MFKRLVFLMFFVIVSLGFIYLTSPIHHSYVNVNHSFVIDEDFKKVKKILIRTNILKRIIELNGATIENSQWQNVTIGMIKLTKWDVIVEGSLKVRIKDLYGILYIKQKTFIGDNKIDILLTLKEPVPPLQTYVNRIIFKRQNNGTTLVIINMKMDVAKKLPEIFHNHMDRIMLSSVSVNLLQAEHELKQVIDEYKNQKIIIPIKLK